MVMYRAGCLYDEVATLYETVLEDIVFGVVLFEDILNGIKSDLQVGKMDDYC